YAELAFEAADLLADRGLDDVQAFGGTVEAEFLGHSHEIPQLSQLHVEPRPRRFITGGDLCAVQLPLGRYLFPRSTGRYESCGEYRRGNSCPRGREPGPGAGRGLGGGPGVLSE